MTAHRHDRIVTRRPCARYVRLDAIQLRMVQLSAAYAQETRARLCLNVPLKPSVVGDVL